MAVVVLVGRSKDTPETSQSAEVEAQVTPAPPQEPMPKPDPVSPADEKLITDPIVEKAIRQELKRIGAPPTGELTKADLENKLQNLTILDLKYTQITDEGLKEVAKLQNLTSLSLGHTKITDAGIKEVAKLQNLEGLGLTGTTISDAGLKEVAKLQKLERLSLSLTKVTKEGVAELKKALPNCQIVGP